MSRIAQLVPAAEANDVASGSRAGAGLERERPGLPSAAAQVARIRQGTRTTASQAALPASLGIGERPLPVPQQYS